MNIFKRPRLKPAAVSTQIRSAATHPFGMLDNYVPLGEGDIRLVAILRQLKAQLQKLQLTATTYLDG